MAPRSDNSIGSLDMARLLDLLNTYEGHDENTSSTQPAPETQLTISKSAEVSSIPATLSARPEPIDPLANPKETVENRFAAHIVHGMSKLKRT